jgi:hypothetical protein
VLQVVFVDHSLGFFDHEINSKDLVLVANNEPLPALTEYVVVAATGASGLPSGSLLSQAELFIA